LIHEVMSLEKRLNCTKGQKETLDYIQKFTFHLITELERQLDCLEINFCTLKTH